MGKDFLNGALSDNRPSKFDPLAQHNKNHRQQRKLQAELKSKGISHLTGGDKRQVSPNQDSRMDESGKKHSSKSSKSSKKDAAAAEYKQRAKEAKKLVRNT